MKEKLESRDDLPIHVKDYLEETTGKPEEAVKKYQARHGHEHREATEYVKRKLAWLREEMKRKAFVEQDGVLVKNRDVAIEHPIWKGVLVRVWPDGSKK